MIVYTETKYKSLKKYIYMTERITKLPNLVLKWTNKNELKI